MEKGNRSRGIVKSNSGRRSQGVVVEGGRFNGYAKVWISYACIPRQVDGRTILGRAILVGRSCYQPVLLYMIVTIELDNGGKPDNVTTNGPIY